MVLDPVFADTLMDAPSVLTLSEPMGLEFDELLGAELVEVLGVVGEGFCGVLGAELLLDGFGNKDGLSSRAAPFKKASTMPEAALPESLLDEASDPGAAE